MQSGRSLSRPRQASPPRKSLMVGDLAQCRAVFERLQGQCGDLLQGTAGPITWEDLVPRFRALRESLLSNNAPLPMFTAALEASSDACLRAGNLAEFLKSVQQLVLVTYPALAAGDQELVLRSYPALATEDQVSRDLENLHLSGSSDSAGSTSEPSPPAHNGAQASMLQRWPEFAGAFLLYFVCIPAASESMDVAAVLRRLPHDLQQCREVSFALQAHTAATQHDGLAFLGLHAEGTWVQKAIMQPRMQRMRERGIAIFGSAYRSLSADVAIALLFMRGVGMDSLLALLKTCAEQGMLPAQHAFSAAQMADAAGPQVLVFRA